LVKFKRDTEPTPLPCKVVSRGLAYGCQIWEMQKAKKTKVQRLKDRAPCHSLKEDLSEGEGEE